MKIFLMRTSPRTMPPRSCAQPRPSAPPLCRRGRRAMRRRQRGALGGEDALGAEEHVVGFLRLEDVVEGFGDHRDLEGAARVGSGNCAELRRSAPNRAELRRTAAHQHRDEEEDDDCVEDDEEGDAG